MKTNLFKAFLLSFTLLTVFNFTPEANADRSYCYLAFEQRGATLTKEQLNTGTVDGVKAAVAGIGELAADKLIDKLAPQNDIALLSVPVFGPSLYAGMKGLDLIDTGFSVAKIAYSFFSRVRRVEVYKVNGLENKKNVYFALMSSPEYRSLSLKMKLESRKVEQTSPEVQVTSQLVISDQSPGYGLKLLNTLGYYFSRYGGILVGLSGLGYSAINGFDPNPTAEWMMMGGGGAFIASFPLKRPIINKFHENRQMMSISQGILGELQTIRAPESENEAVTFLVGTNAPTRELIEIIKKQNPNLELQPVGEMDPMDTVLEKTKKSVKSGVRWGLSKLRGFLKKDKK